MRTDLLLGQQSASHADIAAVRQHARTDDASVDARRPPFDRVTIGLHWATVLLVLTLFASAWLFRPTSPVRRASTTGREVCCGSQPEELGLSISRRFAPTERT